MPIRQFMQRARTTDGDRLLRQGRRRTRRRAAAAAALSATMMRGFRCAAASALVPLLTATSALATGPEQAIEAYLRAVYARDFPTAYRMLSPDERKPEAEYLTQNPSLTGRALGFSGYLASLIEFQDVAVETDGTRAVVAFAANLPDANAAEVRDLTASFDEAVLARLSEDEIRERHRRLADLAMSGSLPVLASPHEEWKLVRAGGEWRVRPDDADAVTVRFDGVAMAGLPWEFEPLQRELRATPGETLQVTYRIKNLADRPITAKARHVLTPEATKYLELVTCFCFLEQTLKPQEEIRLPVTFRVSYEVPDTITELGVRYEFYPVEAPSGDDLW